MSTWWIDKAFLLGSSNPSEAALQKLHGEGFNMILSLLDETKQSPRYAPDRATAFGYKRYCIPITDFEPPSIEQLCTFITLLGSVSADTKILVHCEGGSGRTGTMGAAYWIAKDMSAAQAICKVRKANTRAVETPGQERMLYNFEEHVQKRRREAVDTFRKLVALLYREIGVLDHYNHRELAGKRRLESGFFSTPACKRMSREFYRKTRENGEVESIVTCLEAYTGISLGEVERAFREGHWKNRSGRCSYGGPKWALIAQTTVALQAAIAGNDLAAILRLLQEVSRLEHNNGRIVDKFSELE